MENAVYLAAVKKLETLYGPLSSWQRPHGVRTTSSPKGKISLYHERIAAGNLAEVAFHVESMALATKRDEAEVREFIEVVARATGRPTRLDPRNRWPRIGFAEPHHLDLALDHLLKFFEAHIGQPRSDENAPVYWWVSHNQMHRMELAGGYIWCPQTKKNGGTRETWTNVSRVRKGDIVFSYARKKIQAVGVAIEDAADASAPTGYSSWNDQGWRVAIKWERLECPFSPKNHWDEIARLFPSLHSPMREDGGGNLTYLAALSDTLGLKLLEIAGLENEDAIALVDRDIIEQSGLDRTEVERLYQARVGQGLYRRNVIEVEPRCRVTGVSKLDLLIASHIKPWRQSSNRERLDGNNGLMLSPHIDKLFDAGWISFSDSGDVLVATPEVGQILSVWGVDPSLNIGSFNADQCKYLDYHRGKLFSAKSSTAI